MTLKNMSVLYIHIIIVVYHILNVLCKKIYFFPTQQQATPIKFKSIEDFELCKFSSLNPIDSLVMMGNEANHKITNSMSKGRYYRRTSGIDVPNFFTYDKGE